LQNDKNSIFLQRGPSDLDGREHQIRQDGPMPDLQQSPAVPQWRFRNTSTRSVRFRDRSAQLKKETKQKTKIFDHRTKENNLIMN
jgi:hypothetical protein